MRVKDSKEQMSYFSKKFVILENQNKHITFLGQIFRYDV